jgi:MFS family permease
VFRALWIASVASNVGTWVQNVGAAWLMTSLAPRPLAVALVQVASNLPFFLLAFPAGALADVVDRRRLALVALVWLSASAALLSGLVFAGVVGPRALLALTFAIGMGSALLAPAFASIVPELVPRDEIEPAVALNAISMNLARAIGPAVGGVVVATAGAGANFALNALSFVAVMAVLWRWRPEAPERRLPPEELVGAMRAGLRYVRHSPALGTVLARAGAFVLPASALWALLPLYARDQLGLGPTGYGGLLGCFGAGAVTAGLLLGPARRRLSAERLVTGAALVFAASQLVLAGARALAPAAVALFVAGAAWLSLLSTLNATAQLAIPAWVRARALAIYMLAVFGGLAAGSAGWGALANLAGVPRAFALAALAVVLGRAATLRQRLPEGEGPDLTPASRWLEPQLARSIEPERGPALVTVEYQIDPTQAQAFARAAQGLGAIRRRDGAIRWGLWADVEQPGRYLESFVVESWLEHLRQHERITAADREVQTVARSFHRGAEPPRVRHFIHERIPEDR